MISIIVEPFVTFKQKVKLMKKFQASTCKVTVYENYLYIEKRCKGKDGVTDDRYAQ